MNIFDTGSYGSYGNLEDWARPGSRGAFYRGQGSWLNKRHAFQYGMLEHGASLAANTAYGAGSLAYQSMRGGIQAIRDIGTTPITGAFHLPFDYMSGRAGIMQGLRSLPGKIPLVGMKPIEGINLAERMMFPGGQIPGFLGRTAGEHLRMGAARTMQAYHPKFWPLEIGLSAYFAFSETDTADLADPYNGLARSFTKNMAMTPGALMGMGIGAAVGSIVPVVGPVIGMIGGSILGAEATSAIADIPFRLAEKGRALRLRRVFGGSFLDSEQASTSRQLAMNMIYQSNLNARSSLGSEAISFHS